MLTVPIRRLQYVNTAFESVRRFGRAICQRLYICNWWGKIGTDITFVDDVRITALGAVVELSRRASTVNVPVFLATDVLDALRHHIIWFKELSKRVASKHSARMVMGSVNTKFSKIEIGLLRLR